MKLLPFESRLFIDKMWLAAMMMVCALLLPPGSNAQTKKPTWQLDYDLNVPRDQVICFSLYTVKDNILKLTAQLYPLKDGEDRELRLEIKEGENWKEIAKAEVIEDGWTAPFRVEPWDDTRKISYRVVHGDSAFYEGTIRKNPVDKEEIVIAGFTGNSISPKHGGDIPKTDIIENIQEIDADLLFFSGDQVYDHRRHYEAWLNFGRDFGEIIKDRPTITIPDDHDIGQPNLWGQSGRKSFVVQGHDGGYFRPLEYVKEVERAQTSHLPDPYDPSPIERGIGVYYTDLNWGRISFAILEDRKFKTGPAAVVPEQGPRPDHILNPDYDPKTVDVPEARLLGNRQLEFLDDWGRDWTDADFKVALSQTIFCGGAHIHGKVGGRLHADLDSNGWPQTGRNKAIMALRKAFALHFAGDQHLATIFHHGVNEWRDSNISFCVPSIANLYLRWWEPLEEGKNREPNQPAYLGDHLDGFDNLVTCYAVANPSKEPTDGKELTTRAAGFGVIRLNKNSRQITLECWPRNVDITDPSSEQYTGWPRAIDQTDNYGRQAIAYLPTLKISGQTDPVIQIVAETNHEVVYTLRIKGDEFRPKVFEKGAYTIHVGEGENKKTLASIEARSLEEDRVIEVEF